MANNNLIDYFEKLGTLIDCEKPTDYRDQEIRDKLLLKTIAILRAVKPMRRRTSL